MARRTQRSMIALVFGVMAGVSAALVADGQSPAPSGPSPVTVETIRAAGDEGGLWIGTTSTTGRLELLHRTADLPDHVLRPAVEEAATLQGLAGGGTRGFLLYDDTTIQSIQRQIDPRRQTARYTRDQYPPLPRVERVIDTVGIGARLLVLVDLGGEAETTEAPTEAEAAAATVEGDAGDAAGPAADMETTTPRAGRWLIESVGSEWRWTALPEDLSAVAPLRLVASRGGLVSIVTPASDGQALVADRRGDDWTMTRYPHALTDGFQVLRAMGELVIVEPIAGARGLGATVLSGGEAKEAGRLELPDSEVVGWVATGYAGRVSVVVGGPDGKLWLAQRGLTRPPSAEPTLAELHVEPPPGPAFNEQFLFYGLLALAVLSVLAVRRMDRTEVAVELPEGLMPAPIGRRAVALAIDLAPSIVAVMWLFNTSDPVAVIMPWLALSSDLAALAPGASAIALTAAHGALAEWLISGSIGKRLVGLRTVTVKGGRAGWRNIAIRNLMKMIELLLWPLALFALLNEPHQRMGDLVGRTVVVTRIPAAEASPSEPGDERDDGEVESSTHHDGQRSDGREP